MASCSGRRTRPSSAGRSTTRPGSSAAPSSKRGCPPCSPKRRSSTKTHRSRDGKWKRGQEDWTVCCVLECSCGHLYFCCYSLSLGNTPSLDLKPLAPIQKVIFVLLCGPRALVASPCFLIPRGPAKLKIVGYPCSDAVSGRGVVQGTRRKPSGGAQISKLAN